METQTNATLTEKTAFTLVELATLQLISDGYTNNDIANILHTSVRTVETRRANMMLKSGTKNAASLIKFAVKNNLVA
jgi:DNA-binding NarL/FixJ family response regulator